MDTFSFYLVFPTSAEAAWAHAPRARADHRGPSFLTVHLRLQEGRSPVGPASETWPVSADFSGLCLHPSRLIHFLCFCNKPPPRLLLPFYPLSTKLPRFLLKTLLWLLIAPSIKSMLLTCCLFPSPVGPLLSSFVAAGLLAPATPTVPWAVHNLSPQIPHRRPTLAGRAPSCHPHLRLNVASSGDLQASQPSLSRAPGFDSVHSTHRYLIIPLFVSVSRKV